MLDILLKAGEKYQMKRAGIITYFTVRSEVDWIGYPMPAIYTDPKLRAFREWLPANGWEGRSELAGSFVSDNIEDYYLTPWDMGYHNRINWDRDFIGKDALVAMKDKEHRVKKMLIWDPEDVTRVYRSQFEKDEIPFKHMGMPRATYGFTQYDTVYTKSGDVAGLSVCSIFTANEGRYTSAAVLKPEYAEAGQELEILWGEPNGGSRKKHVEKHRQTKIKATVASAPYSVLAMNKR